MRRTVLLAVLGALALGLFATAGAAPAAKDAAKPAVVTDSLALLEHAVARDSSRWNDLYRLGVMYLDRDRPKDAQKVFMRANKLKPKDVATMVNLGAAYDASGMSKEAQEVYGRALELAPDDSLANCRLAGSLYAAYDYQKAIDLLRHIIATKPRSHCAYFTLGVAFADAGIYKEAVAMWKKVIEYAPESAEAISARESIEVLEKVIQQR